MRYKRPAREHYHHWLGVYLRGGRARRPVGLMPVHPDWAPRVQGPMPLMSIARPLLNRAYGRMGRLYGRAHRRAA